MSRRRRAENDPPDRRRRTSVLVRESGEIPLWTAPPALTVDEDDVIACLAGLGDDFVARYRSGELSRDEAYSMARCWKRQSYELQPRARL